MQIFGLDFGEESVLLNSCNLQMLSNPQRDYKRNVPQELSSTANSFLSVRSTLNANYCLDETLPKTVEWG